MKTAFIPPTSLIHQVSAVRDSPIQMCIASHIKTGDIPYYKYYQEAGQQGKHVILDNGVWETGISVGMEELLQFASAIRATEVVIPDTMKNRATTLRQAAEFLGYVEMRQSRLVPLRFMFVPQGKDFEEWLDCYYEAISTFGTRFHTIGIPKWLGRLDDAGEEGRGWFLKDPRMRFFARYDYHLLGVNSLFELEYIRNHTDVFMNIRSCDTSLPFVMAQEPDPMQVGPTRNTIRHQVSSRRVDNYFKAPESMFHLHTARMNAMGYEYLDQTPVFGHKGIWR